MYYVYVLKDKLSSNYYIGYTSDLKRRLKEHQEKRNQSTKFGGYDLVYYEAYLSKNYAMKREKVLKHHGRVKKFLIDRIEESLK